MKDFPNLGLDVYDIYDIFDRNTKEVFNVSLINCDDVEDGLYDDYLFETEDEAEEKCWEIGEHFNKLAGMKEIKIYRCLELNSVDDLNRDDLGECWAWDRDAAVNFGLNNLYNPNFLLIGIVNKENINWKESLNRYAINSLFNRGMEENELVIKNNGIHVKLLDVEHLD